MTDPKTARDCLAHCRDVLTDEQMTIAVEQIERYVWVRSKEVMKEYEAVMRRAFAGNLFAEPPIGWPPGRWWQE
jgi:hypothetical protein